VHCITKEIPLIQSGCQDSSDCDLPNVNQHSCVSGECGIVNCDAGFADCDGSNENGCETQLGSDRDCSACGDDCSADFSHASGSCQSGSCVMGACLGGYADCDGSDANGCEEMLGSDTQCSACGDDCIADFANASGSCQSGSCAMGACLDNYADCDRQSANGCEVELGTDSDCSGCGDNCTYKYAHSVGECQAGSCRIKYCADFYGDCNATAEDGCETALGSNQHCSACDDSCAADEDCTVEAGQYHCLTRGCPDQDGDGFADVACGGTDCNDAAANVNPAAVETCNNQDDNCDGNVDEGQVCASEPSSGCGCGSAGGDRPAGVLAMLIMLALISGRRKEGRAQCRGRRHTSRSR